MKAINILISIYCCTAMLMACNAEEEMRESEIKVPLEINIDNGTTRSVIEGTTIPYQTSFGIIGEYNNQLINEIGNISVFYDGQCKLSKDVYLDNSSMFIKAYYPYSSTLHKNLAEIKIQDQVDFLYGSAVNSDGELQVINSSNPKANIVFKHALSRITFKVRHTTAYGSDFTLKSVFIDYVGITAFFDLTLQHLTPIEYASSTFPLSVFVTKEFTSFDLLLFPTTKHEEWVGAKWIRFSGVKGTLGDITLEGKWEAGQQYTYEVTFDDNGITVSKAIITPWESTTQSGIDITDNNLVTD